MLGSPTLDTLNEDIKKTPDSSVGKELVPKSEGGEINSWRVTKVFICGFTLSFYRSRGLLQPAATAKRQRTKWKTADKIDSVLIIKINRVFHINLNRFLQNKFVKMH